MIYFNDILNMNTFEIEQGTPEWLLARLGVVTASVAHSVIKEGRKAGSQSAERKTLMLDLIGQICTGVINEQAPFKQAQWGHENEPYAREAYEARNFEVIETCGLIYKDESLRCAISPDGITDAFGLEIKNPWTTQVHLSSLFDGEIKPEYITQCQYSMWVTGFDRWDFCSYDHRMRGDANNRLWVKIIERDPEFMSKFDNEIPKFIEEMDEKLSQLGFKFGDQWRDL